MQKFIGGDSKRTRRMKRNPKFLIISNKKNYKIMQKISCLKVNHDKTKFGAVLTYDLTRA